MWRCWTTAVLAVLLGACEQQQVGIYAKLRGVHDLTNVGQLVFVTSTEGSELRVIDSEPDVLSGRDVPDFVRAPNPIGILSIPVLDRPIALAPDVHFDGEGAEVRGPYLYVQGSGAREISVVGATPELLKELVRIPTSGPVIAIAGVGPQAEGGESLLFHADWQEGRSRLYRTTLAAPAALSGVPAPVGLLDEGGQPVIFVGESVSALAVLPRGTDGSVRLAIGLRAEGGLTGRSLLLTLDPTGSAYVSAPVVLDFGGPVRMLKTHPRVTRTEGTGDAAIEFDVLPAGARIFAALDEAACTAPVLCGGVVAVDGITLDRDGLPDLTLGQRSLDGRGQTMVTLETGGTYLVDFEVSPKFHRVTSSTSGDVMPLGGLIATGAGAYTIFDAVALEFVNLSSDLPSLNLDGMVYRDAAGAVLEIPVQTTGAALIEAASLKLNHGVVREEVISVIFQSDIPGLRELWIDPAGAGDAVILPTGLRLADPSLASRLQVDDVATLSGDGCALSTTVTAIDDVTGEITLADAPAGTCASATFAAAGTAPWIVIGSQSGWLGRTADGEVFASVEGIPFAHPPAYVPGAPQLQFRFRVPATLAPAKGTYVAFRTLDGFAFQSAAIESVQFNKVFLPPSALTILPKTLYFETGSVWAAYPASNQVWAFSPDRIIPGAYLGIYSQSRDELTSFR